MNTAQAEIPTPQLSAKPTILFVDDEKRVLNSMRAMFRRDYTLFLTTRGDEALKIISENTIDVVVADQRMPVMTGVEVLSAVKKNSPGTVRILLTGYADLDAIEGAMNDGEVFRFLSKPCAAEELRGTIKLATEIARDTAGNTAVDIDAEADEGLLANAAEQGLDDSVVSQLSVLTTGTDLDVSSTPISADRPVAPGGIASGRELSEIQSTATAVLDHAEGHAHQTSGEERDSDDSEGEEIVMSGDHHHVVDNGLAESGEDFGAATTVLDEAPVLAPPRQPSTPDNSSKLNVVGTGKYKVSIIVFSLDEQFARSVGRSLQDYFYTFHASNIAHLMNGIKKVAPAVLITDISEDPDVIQQLTANLKQRVPEMVTMVASHHRDADLMVKLINFGQVFRFIDKPLSSTACKRHVREAIKKHIQLRDNPELIQRHQVVKMKGESKLPSSIGRLIDSLGRVRKLWGAKTRQR